MIVENCTANNIKEIELNNSLDSVGLISYKNPIDSHRNSLDSHRLNSKRVNSNHNDNKKFDNFNKDNVKEIDSDKEIEIYDKKHEVCCGDNIEMKTCMIY